MEENLDFRNFDSVWARVTEPDYEDIPRISAEAQPEEKICILPRCEKSRAIRFIPEI